MYFFFSIEFEDNDTLEPITCQRSSNRLKERQEFNQLDNEDSKSIENSFR